MDYNYKFENFDNDLDNGYKIYLTFVNNRYLVYKTSENCYTQELLDYSNIGRNIYIFVIISQEIMNLLNRVKALLFKRFYLHLIQT